MVCVFSIWILKSSQPSIIACGKTLKMGWVRELGVGLKLVSRSSVTGRSLVQRDRDSHTVEPELPKVVVRC